MGGAAQFPVTRWTLVARVREGDDPERDNALGELCADYWLPVYAYYRRSGRDVESGKDMTQGFFEMLLRRGDFAKPDRDKGRLRTFLLTAARNFATDQWNRSQAIKRGGGAELVPIDADEAESRLAELPDTDGDTPERAFDRQWALTLLDKAFLTLEAEYEKLGNAKPFAALKPTLVSGEGYAEAARQAGCSEGAARVTAFRMRKRLRLIIEEELRETVGSTSDFSQELRNFIAVMER
jgi:RNA polymerase sigma-70 factor (ECF subfamily)